jgi:hypothetical protein
VSYWRTWPRSLIFCDFRDDGINFVPDRRKAVAFCVPDSQILASVFTKPGMFDRGLIWPRSMGVRASFADEGVVHRLELRLFPLGVRRMFIGSDVTAGPIFALHSGLARRRMEGLGGFVEQLARRGWDACTRLGSPDGKRMTSLLSGANAWSHAGHSLPASIAGPSQKTPAALSNRLTNLE